MEFYNEVTCIKGEIHSLLTLMRLHTKWSSGSKQSRDTMMQEESGLVNSFKNLHEYLEGTYDLREIDCVEYIQPFHQVIISEEASGPITSAALTSLSKFVLYGFLSSDYPHAQDGINLISNSIAHCIFEETDWESDEVILMKLLELSIMSLRCDAASLLLVDSAWEIYSTCLSIQAQSRASKILRSQAETALKHLTLTVFGLADSAMKNHRSLPSEYTTAENDFGFSESVRGISWQSASNQHTISSPVGITLLLGKIMSVLTGLMDSEVQKKDTVKNALTLVNISLESGGPSLGSMSPLVDLLRGDVCRHLLRASQSEDLEVFSLALRVVFNLFMSIKDHMKVQLEVFITSVHLRLLKNSLTVLALPTAKEELAMESLLEFCQEPSLMHDIYVNYDCDVQCTNLFDTIITSLSVKAVPGGISLSSTSSSSVDKVTTGAGTVSGTGTGKAKAKTKNTAAPETLPLDSKNQNQTKSPTLQITILHKLALDGILAILHSVSSRCAGSGGEGVTYGNSAASSSAKGLSVATQFGWRSAPFLAPDPPPLDQQVDRWCALDPSVQHTDDCEDSGSTSTSPISKHLVFAPRRNAESDEGVYIPGNGRGSKPVHVGAGTNADLGSATLQVAIPDRKRNVSCSTSTSTTESLSISTEDESGDMDADVDFTRLARARTAEVLRQRKTRKRNLKLVAELFNANPLNGGWIRRAAELGLLPKLNPNAVEGKGGAGLVDSIHIARFLKSSPGLNKTQIGEFISKGPPDIYPFHAAVLKDYVDTFDFSGHDSSFDGALRIFLGHFRLPGEAQCIDRLMEAFSRRLFLHLGPGRPFASSDAAFILSFSTIMLNTDLHNPQIPDAKRMKKEEFIRNNRGINDGKDLPREFLEQLYDRIQTKQIQVDSDLTDTGHSQPQEYLADTGAWDAWLRRGAAGQAPASFTPTVTARRGVSGRREAHNWSLLATNETDMFFTMANPVMSILLGHYWEMADTDDQIFGRLLTGLEEFATVCDNLALNQYLNRLIQKMSERAISMMILLQSFTTIKNGKLESPLPSKASSDRTEKATKLVSTPQWESLFVKHTGITAGAKNNATNVMTGSHPHTKSGPWVGASEARGALMIRAILHILWKYVKAVDIVSWSCVLRVLLCARSLRSLPDSLCEVDDFTDARGASLSLSMFANALREAQSVQDAPASDGTSGSEQSLWLSVTSLGGLLWSSDTAPGSSTGSQQTSDHGASVVSKHQAALLRTGLVAARADQLLFGRLKLLSDDALKRVLECLLSNIGGIESRMRRSPSANALANARFQESPHERTGNDASDSINLLVSTEGDNEYSADSMLSPGIAKGNSAPSVTELDAVVVLEWVSRIVFANRHRVSVIWPTVHDFLRVVIESAEGATVDSLRCGYLLERCVVTTIRAAIHLLDTAGSHCGSASEKGHTDEVPGYTAASSEGSSTLSSTGCSTNVIQELIWSSLALLPHIPAAVLACIGDRVGAGLLALLRGGPSIEREELWGIIFSLLHVAVGSESGRIFVWEALCHLIDTNSISSMNFHFCRKMALQFLFQSFGRQDAISLLDDLVASEKSSLKTSSSGNPWITGTLLHLLRLTLMVLAGYQKYKLKAQFASMGVTAPTGHPPLHPKHDSDTHTSSSELAVFYASALSPEVSATAPKGTPVRSTPQPTQESEQLMFTVSAVLLSGGDGIASSNELFTVRWWLQVIAVFADLSGSCVSAVSRHAAFCLRTLLLAGSTVGLPDACWLEAVQLLLIRLTLVLPTPSGSVFAATSAKPSPAEQTQVMQTCLRSCSIVFETMVAHFRVLRYLPDFQSDWLKFLTILSSNANSASRGSPFHDELIGMIAALIRLIQGIDNTLSSVGKPANSNTSSFGSVFASTVTALTGGTLLSQSSSSSSSSGTNAGVDSSANRTRAPGPPLPDVDDSTVLRLSWRALSSVYPALPALLRARYPQIHSANVREHAPTGTQVTSLMQSAAIQGSNAAQSSPRPPNMRRIDARTQIV